MRTLKLNKESQLKSLFNEDEWAAPADFLLKIVRYAKSAKPKLIVECGSGVSTEMLFRASPGCHIVSLEHDPVFMAKTEKRTGGATDLRLCKIKDWWYDYEHNETPIDMIVIDGPPAYLSKDIRYGAKCLFKYLSPGAHVFIDDLKRPNDRLIFDIWESEFPKLRFRYVESERGLGIITNET